VSRRGVAIHWSEEDDRDVERWHAERVERAGGPLFFHAEQARIDEAWAAKVRKLCAEARAERGQSS
jgi:hypothetical protein